MAERKNRSGTENRPRQRQVSVRLNMLLAACEGDERRVVLLAVLGDA